MTSTRKTEDAAKALSKVALEPSRRQELWDAIERRIDMDTEENGTETFPVTRKRNRAHWGQFGAAVAALVLIASGITYGAHYESLLKTTKTTGTTNTASVPTPKPTIQLTLTLPNGQTVKPDQRVAWKDLSLSLIITSLPPGNAGTQIFGVITGDGTKRISQETVSTSIGSGELWYTQRKDSRYAYYAIVNGSQNAYVLQAVVTGNRGNANGEVTSLLNRLHLNGTITNSNTPSNLNLPGSITDQNPTLEVDASSMTANGGPLSQFLHSATIRSHQFLGSSGTAATVLASVDGDGTLVAVNYQGDGAVTAPGYESTLYFLSAKSNKVMTVAKLGDHGVVSAAALSRRWIVWTDFVPNGVMQNIGVMDRVTGKSSYVVPMKMKDEQQFMKRSLQKNLFLEGNILYVQGFASIQSYNMLTKKWSTFYTPSSDGNLQLASFELTDQGAVVELTGGNYETDVVVRLNQQGKQVGKMYHLPKGVYNLTGVSGNQVFFDGDKFSYEWMPGSSTIQKITGVSGWFSGVGGQYVTGWDYSQQLSGQLVNLATRTHYNFDASSAVVTSTKLYWTKGNSLFSATLPK